MPTCFARSSHVLLGRASSNVAREFAEDPNSPWLVSFPRTGSHWLRMMLERYSARPLLPRSFFDHDSTDYLLNHTHDLDFSCTVRRVIYLYRDPVPDDLQSTAFPSAGRFRRALRPPVEHGVSAAPHALAGAAA